MDSDDTISPENGQKLQQLASRDPDPSVLGYVMQVHCPGGDDETDVTVVDHVKLFRNHPELRFEGRIHEQILPAIRRLGGETAWTDVFVVHSGSDLSPESRRRKQQRDLRILELDLLERPEHPFVLFNLGMTYADMSEHRTAADYLERSLAVSGAEESHVRKAYALLIGCRTQLQDLEAAAQLCTIARAMFPTDPELLFRQGIVAHQQRNLLDAERAYLAVLAGEDERHFSSIDRGIVGFKARHNLAIVYEDMNEFEKARHQWELVVTELPSYRDGWRGLYENRLRCRDLDAALATIERMQQLPALLGEAYRAQAQIAVANDEIDTARSTLLEGVERCGDQEEPLRSLCQFLFERSSPGEAEPFLRRLSRICPEDGSVYHNLGTARLNAGDAVGALEAFDESIRLRPAEAATYLFRGYALDGLGRPDDAVLAFQRAEQVGAGSHVGREARQRLSRYVAQLQVS